MQTPTCQTFTKSAVVMELRCSFLMVFSRPRPGYTSPRKVAADTT